MKHTKVVLHSPAYERALDAVQEKVPKLAEELIKYEAEQEGQTIPEDPAAGMPQFRETLRKYDPAGNLVEQRSKVVDPEEVYMDVKYRARRFRWSVEVASDGVITATRYDGEVYNVRKSTITYEPLFETLTATI